MEAGVVVVGTQPVYWHLPAGRTTASLPDSRKLWEVFWDLKWEAALGLLGFAHTHPGSGVPSPSWTDLTTFAAVESGLGRRLHWWIASSTHLIVLNWQGPDVHDYHTSIVAEEPVWLHPLRGHAEELSHGT